jgi:predicted transcriptional regulator
MDKKLAEMASEIVKMQVSLNPVSNADIASSLWQVYCTLQELQRAETAGIDIELAQPAAGTSQETARGKMFREKRKFKRLKGKKGAFAAFL